MFFLLVIGAIYENKKNSDRFLFGAFLLLFLLFAFRSYNVGKDTPSYIDEYIEGFSFERGIDLGFAVLLQVIRSLEFSSRQFLIIISFIIIVPIYYYIKYCTVANRMFTTLLYMTIGNMTFNLAGMRQSVAISVILVGLVIAKKTPKTYLQYLILIIAVLLAFTFHNTAQLCVLIVPILWLAKRDFFPPKKNLIVYISAPLIGLILGQYSGPLINYFMVSKYGQYEADFGNSNFIAYFIIPYCMFLYVTWLMLKVKRIDSVDNFSYLCAFVYILAASASIYMPILARLEYYFSLQFVALIGNMTARLPRSERASLMFVITTICITFFLVSTPGGTLAIDNYILMFR